MSHEARRLGYLLEVLDYDPGNIALRLRAAESMMAQGMLVLAVEQCTRILDQDPGHEEATCLLSRVGWAMSQRESPAHDWMRAAPPPTEA